MGSVNDYRMQITPINHTVTPLHNLDDNLLLVPLLYILDIATDKAAKGACAEFLEAEVGAERLDVIRPVVDT
jgi:hypothetical protein